MADFTFLPSFGQTVTAGPAATLLTTLDDGVVIGRLKHSNTPQRWSERYEATGAEFDAIKAFYLLKGLLTPFTKLSYDNSAAPTTEATVRFDGPLEWERVGQGVFVVGLTFVKSF